MKIKNKVTGEIVDFCKGYIGDVGCGQYIVIKPATFLDKDYRYDSWDKFVSEWEEYKEPEHFFTIGQNGNINKLPKDSFSSESLEAWREIDNFFETEVAARKALEELKAWKRLKDHGFGFGGYTRNHTGTYEVLLKREIPYSDYDNIDEDVRLLFKGEDE